MSRRRGVALIGAGKIAKSRHLPAWAQCERGDLVHVVDSDASTAEGVATQWGIPSWSTTLEAALDDPTVEAVDICTPFGAHADQCVAALEAGKHVFVEKPAAHTEADVRRIADTAARASLVALTCENWVYSPAVSKARSLVADGVIGTPRLFASEHFSGMSLAANPAAGVRRVPGSYLVNAGVHTINTSLMFMGEYERVVAFALGKGDDGVEGDGDSETVVSATFAHGGLGSMYFSGSTQCRRPGSRQIRIVGDLGRVESDLFTGQVEWSEGHVWAGGGAEHVWRDPTGSTGHPEAVEHFLDCLDGSAQPLTSVASQIASHRAVDGIIQSYRTGEVVTLSSTDGQAA